MLGGLERFHDIDVHASLSLLDLLQSDETRPLPCTGGAHEPNTNTGGVHEKDTGEALLGLLQSNETRPLPSTGGAHEPNTGGVHDPNTGGALQSNTGVALDCENNTGMALQPDRDTGVALGCGKNTGGLLQSDTGVALDCGAGIGRVSKSVLLERFRSVELIEPIQSFLDQAVMALPVGTITRSSAVGLQVRIYVCKYSHIYTNICTYIYIWWNRSSRFWIRRWWHFLLGRLCGQAL